MEPYLESKDEIYDFKTCRIRKFNRTTSVVSGVCELKKSLDDSIILSFESLNFVAGQYKKIFGRTLGPTCKIAHEPHLADDLKYFLSHTNFSIKHGECPITAQHYLVKDFAPRGLGDYLPAYLPGNERWKVNLIYSKSERVLGGATFYAIIRDNQKLFDSKFGK